MRGVDFSYHSYHLILLLGDGDCRDGTGQRATSILAGIIKCPRNHVRGFHDYCLRAMFLHPCEIQLSWHSHLNLHYELKAPNVLHWNCQWSFGATFQASCIWSEWCCIITNSLIYCALTGYGDDRIGRVRFDMEDCPKVKLDRRMIGWSRRKRI